MVGGNFPGIYFLEPLIQVASMHFFYSMWWLEVLIVIDYYCFSNRYSAALFEICILKEVRILRLLFLMLIVLRIGIFSWGMNSTFNFYFTVTSIAKLNWLSLFSLNLVLYRKR